MYQQLYGSLVDVCHQRPVRSFFSGFPCSADFFLFFKFQISGTNVIMSIIASIMICMIFFIYRFLLCSVEVEAVMFPAVGHKDVIVFGVELPHCDGRAGMAAILDDQKDLDLSLLTVVINRVSRGGFSLKNLKIYSFFWSN